MNIDYEIHNGTIKSLVDVVDDKKIAIKIACQYFIKHPDHEYYVMECISQNGIITDRKEIYSTNPR